MAVVVGDTTWMYASGGIGTNLWIYGGNFLLTSVNSSTSATLMFLGLDSDVLVAGNTVPAGAVVAAGLGGYKVPVALSAIANFTDNSTGSAGSTIAAGVGRSLFIHPLTSLVTGLSTAAIDLLTNYTPGFRFKILSIDFVTTVAGTGSGASQTFNLEIGTTNLTGGVVNVTLASTATVGAITAGSAVTANNTGTASDNISLEMAAGGTVFTAGAGYFVIRLQNLDDADFTASVASKLSSLFGFLGKP